MGKKVLIKIVEIPKVATDGYLCFAQYPEHIPFPIRRVFYIFGVESGEARGTHAHKKTDQILFCIQSSIKIILDDGKTKEEIVLDQPEKGVVLEKMVWHEMHDFKKDTILLVLASKKHDPKDYIRDYKEFLKLSGNEKSKTD